MTTLEKLIAEHCPNGVDYVKLGEIGEILRGGNLQKKDFTESGFPCIHYGQIHTGKLGFFADKTGPGAHSLQGLHKQCRY